MPRSVFCAAALIHRGLGAAALMFMMVGMTQFNDGPFQRPHPVIWRFVLAVSVLYLLVLVFLLFQVSAIGLARPRTHGQTPMQGRHLLSHLDPALGTLCYAMHS